MKKPLVVAAAALLAALPALMAAQDQMDSDPTFFNAKVITARFYAESVLTQAAGLAQSIKLAGPTTNRMSVEMF